MGSPKFAGKSRVVKFYLARLDDIPKTLSMFKVWIFETWIHSNQIFSEFDYHSIETQCFVHQVIFERDVFLFQVESNKP